MEHSCFIGGVVWASWFLVTWLTKQKEGSLHGWKNTILIFFDAQIDDIIIIYKKVKPDDFILIMLTKGLLRNAAKESVEGQGFLCLDSTHKLISCRFMFSTLISATISKEASDIANVIHSSEARVFDL